MINFDLIVGFEWDEGNRRKNEVKHSVSQIEAEEVFLNSPLLVNTDEKHSRQELRYFALGTRCSTPSYVHTTNRSPQPGSRHRRASQLPSADQFISYQFAERGRCTFCH